MKNFKRLFSLAIALTMLFALTLLVSAENEYVKWELSEDMSTLTGDGKVYTRYEEPFAFWSKPLATFVYANKARNSNYSVRVSAPYKDADLVSLDIGSPNAIYYATSEVKESLDRFFNGDGVYYLKSGTRFSKLDATVKDAIFNDKGRAETRTEEVYGLSGYKVVSYEITVFDESDSFYYVLGRAFYLDGKYWFVDYSTLPNNYFTADGEFSFRSGEVTLCALDESLAKEINSASNELEYRYGDSTWEDYDPYYEKDTSDLPEYFFWIVFSVIGFAIPAFLGGAATIVAKLKKLKKPKYFYSVSITCAVWIVCAVIIAIMVA